MNGVADAEPMLDHSRTNGVLGKSLSSEDDSLDLDPGQADVHSRDSETGQRVVYATQTLSPRSALQSHHTSVTSGSTTRSGNQSLLLVSGASATPLSAAQQKRLAASMAIDRIDSGPILSKGSKLEVGIPATSGLQPRGVSFAAKDDKKGARSSTQGADGNRWSVQPHSAATLIRQKGQMQRSSWRNFGIYSSIPTVKKATVVRDDSSTEEMVKKIATLGVPACFGWIFIFVPFACLLLFASWGIKRKVHGSLDHNETFAGVGMGIVLLTTLIWWPAVGSSRSRPRDRSRGGGVGYPGRRSRRSRWPRRSRDCPKCRDRTSSRARGRR